MKNKYKFFALLGLLPFFAQAQLTNNGATIVVESGATLVVEGTIDNNGTITNSGTIEVEGDFDNTGGTLTSDAGTASLLFSGEAAQTLTLPSAATVNDVSITNTMGDVTLAGADLTVNGDLNFAMDAKNLVIGDNNLTIGTMGSLMSTNPSDAGGYIEADAAGKVIKNLSSTGLFTFEIGDAGNYSPLAVTHSGTYGGTSSIQANLMPLNHPNIPDDADDYIERYWSFQNSGITGFSGDLVGTYAAGDVQGMEGDMVGARFESGEWEFLTAAQSGSTVTATTTAGSSDLTGMNFYGKADIKVFLQGAFSSGTMSTNLTLPLTSPYLDAPKTVGSIPADVTDWIKIETRDASNSIETVTSAFLKNDGTIVDENGTSLPLCKDASTSSIIAIYHRNHLPIRTAAVRDMVTTTQHDFSTSLSQAYDNSALSTDAMVDMGGGVFGTFRANVTGDTNLNIVDFFAAKSNSSPTQTGVYSPFDINMDGILNIVDFIIAKSSTSPTRVAHL